MWNSAKARRCPKFASCSKSLLKVSEQTYYPWRQKYGGMKPEMAKHLKALEKENARLKKMVAEQALNREILKEVAKGNG
jgi:putative transposase